MNYQPLHEKIIVLPFPPDKETASGILIPDTVQERPSKATVVAVGKGLKDRPMEIKEGDIVFHVKNAGTQIPDTEYFILRDADCLCRLAKD